MVKQCIRIAQARVRSSQGPPTYANKKRRYLQPVVFSRWYYVCMKYYGERKSQTIPADRARRISDADLLIRENRKICWFKEQSEKLLALNATGGKERAEEVENAISRRIALEEELTDLLHKRDEYIQDAITAGLEVAPAYLEEMDVIIVDLYKELYGLTPRFVVSRIVGQGPRRQWQDR